MWRLLALAILAAIAFAGGARAQFPGPNPSATTTISNLSLGLYPVELYGTARSVVLGGDGAITSGTGAFSSNSANWTPADIGDQITIFYASAPTTIAAPPQPTVVTPGSNTVLTNNNVVCYPRGSLGGQNYYIILTYVGAGGETTGSTELGPVACGANTIPEITSPSPTYGAQSYNVYMSNTAGTETLQNQAPNAVNHTFWMNPNGLTSGGATVPVSNTTSIIPPLFTTIKSVTDAHHVVLTANAGSNVSSGNFSYGPDATTAINAALTACGNAGGGRVTVNGQYLAYSANIAVPAKCSIGGQNPVFGDQTSLNTMPMLSGFPAIWLNPSFSITLASASGVSSLGVYQWGLPNVTMTTRTGTDGSTSFSGTAIKNVANAQDPQVSNVFIVGFNQAISAASAQRWTIEQARFQSNNGISFTHNHDWSVVKDSEYWNYYSGNASWNQTTYAITAVGNSGSLITVTIPNSNILQPGDTVQGRAFTRTSFPGGTDQWVVQSVASGVVTLANSQFAPATTGTWTSGGNLVAVASTNSLAPGQTVTGTNIGASNTNTVGGVDPYGGTITLINPTIGAGSGTALSFTNPAYSGSGATLNLNQVVGGGVAYYSSDSQGTLFQNANSYGEETCWQGDQVSTNDLLASMGIVSSQCDAAPNPQQVGLLVTHQQNTLITGDVKWTGGDTTAYGMTFLLDPGSIGTAASDYAVQITGTTLVSSGAVGLMGSILSGKVLLTGVDNVLGNAGMVQDFLNVSAGVDEVNIANSAMSGTSLGFTTPQQGNVWLSGDTSLKSSSPGSRLLQVFSASGTWYKMGGLSYADVLVCGGGGSGGSGASVASGTAASGGGGGGGGGCSPLTRLNVNDLGATETVTVGGGGNQVSGVVGGNGSTGNPGSNSTFGTHAIGFGGGAGGPGASAANSGGGGGSLGFAGQSSNGSAAGSAGTTTGGASGLTNLAMAGNSTFGTGGTGATGVGSAVPGQGSGGGGDTSGAQGSAGGAALITPAGGGGGGGITAVPGATNGGTGGTAWSGINGVTAGKGPAGGAGAGSSPTLQLSYVPGSGGSGGASNAGGNGFDGGAGVNGGGGGGGGACEPATCTSGAGKAGGGGFVAVWNGF